jgi:glycosyltransferase involved in cell wall biosynthesis
MSDPTNSELTCSFIIPHYGREGMLVDTVKSIAALDTQSQASTSTDSSTQQFNIEVIIATKNKSLDYDFSDLAKIINIEIVHAPMSVTISTQRNMGFEHANGDVVAFLDADIELEKNWLRQLYPLLNNETKLVSAVQVASKNASPLEVLRTELSNAHVDCEVEFLPGRNLLMTRDTFIASGGFPEHLVTCEDYVFTQKIGEQGKLFYSTASTYVHLGEDKVFIEMAKKEIWRGQSNLASLKGRTIGLSEYPSFIAPPLFTVSFTLLLLFSFTGFGTLAALCSLASIGVIGLYSLRLYKIAKHKVSLLTAIKFYALYFPARTWGTILGLIKPIATSSHS